MRKTLKGTGDLAKLNSKIALYVALPTHLLVLKNIIQRIPSIKKELETLNSPIDKIIHLELDPPTIIVELIGNTISDGPSNYLNVGNYIKKGYNDELDELRDISRNAKQIISPMEKDERQRSDISSLKIKYDKVFGYFIEVTKTHLNLVPSHYICKQTLVNTERFITDELKQLEEKILKAEEKIVRIVRELYTRVIRPIQEFSPQLNRNSDLIALLDTLSPGGELVQRRILFVEGNPHF